MSLEGSMDQFFKDLEDMWGKDGGFYYDPPITYYELQGQSLELPSPNSPPRLPTTYYKPPTNPYAMKIWSQCNFRGKGERKGPIERGLFVWAANNHLRYMKDDVEHINWEMNGTKICGTWSAFVLWFFCSCTKVDRM